jgi:hypothetical protein
MAVTKSEQLKSLNRIQGLHAANEESKRHFEAAVNEPLFSKEDTAKIIAALKEKRAKRKSDRTQKAERAA